MARRGFAEGQSVTVECALDDGVPRAVHGLRVTPYDLPDACVVAYYPEANPLVPLDQHDELSKTPAYKSTPVRIRAEAPT
jgi:anaerobic selenocysteine-containing dehydrogenase